MARHFADDITIQNAHDANAQCTTLSVQPNSSLRSQLGINVIAKFAASHCSGSLLPVYFESAYDHSGKPSA